MDFPNYVPSRRNYDPGDWPIKAFNAQDGAEVRILYGTKRTKMTLQLGYNAITDVKAQSFIEHFIEMKGTYLTFDLPSGAKEGWAGDASLLDVAAGNRWRYAESPQVESLYPGVSNVTVSLVGVL